MRRADDLLAADGSQLLGELPLVGGPAGVGEEPPAGAGELRPAHPPARLQVEQVLLRDGRVESVPLRHRRRLRHAREPDGVQDEQLGGRGDGRHPSAASRSAP